MSDTFTVKEVPNRLPEREPKKLRVSDAIGSYLEKNATSLHRLQQELSARKIPKSTIARILRLPEQLLETCQ